MEVMTRSVGGRVLDRSGGRVGEKSEVGVQRKLNQKQRILPTATM